MEREIVINKDLKFGFQDLMRLVSFETEFTLRDVLRACINSEIPMDILRQILQCQYIRDYWDEAESKPFDNDNDIEYLEVYLSGDKQTYENKRCDDMFWGIHGIGKEGVISDDIRENCTKEDVQKMEQEGYHERFAIEFSPMYKLTDYPIRICRNLCIMDYDAADNMDLKVDLVPTITLIDLLCCVLWELSLVGSPEQRDKELEGLRQTLKDFEEGKVETVPWEDVKERIRTKFNLK